MSLSGGPLAGDSMSALQVALNARSYPYLIQQGVKLGIAQVRVRITGSITGTGPKIRGFRANVPIVAEAPLGHVAGGDVYVGIDLELTDGFPAETRFFDRYQIDWEVSRDGNTWEYAGTSANQIYVCLADPNMNGASMFRTLVHLACSNDRATSETEAKTKTWELFSKNGGPSDVKTWDGRQLYYYQPGTVFENQPPGYPGNAFCSIANLLKMSTGQCSSWAELLQDAWSVNGVSSGYVLVVATQGTEFYLFLVKSWTDLSADPMRPFWYQTTPPSMVPGPPGAGGNSSPFGYYDDPNDRQFFLNQKTVKGQGTGAEPDKCPSQKIFDNHHILLYKGRSTIRPTA